MDGVLAISGDEHFSSGPDFARDHYAIECGRNHEIMRVLFHMGSGNSIE